MSYVEVAPTVENEQQLKELLAANPGVRLLGDLDDIAEAVELNQNHLPQPSAEFQLRASSFELEAMRRALTSLDERLARCESIKIESNAHFSEKRAEDALKGYVKAIWLLKRGEPGVSRSLASDETPRGSDAINAFGAGPGTEADEVAEVGEHVAPRLHALRETLHVNAAAALLQIEEWAPAAAACAFVLGRNPKHPKALFRLAKAHEASDNLATAVSTLVTLLEVEGQENNREARVLLYRLRKRLEEEKASRGGIFIDDL